MKSGCLPLGLHGAAATEGPDRRGNLRRSGLFRVRSPRVTVTTPGRPPHRAHSGHDALIRRLGQVDQGRLLPFVRWADIP
jgi:hypothetical protein